MNRSILLIDDDPAVLSMLARSFERAGWSVSSATNARTGIEIYDRDPPHVVVLDLDMPGINGMQALEILRQRDPDATVVMLTGQSDVGTAVEAMRLGAENFLTKPFDQKHLHAVAERAFEKADLRRRSRMLIERQAGAVTDHAYGRNAAGQEIARQVQLLAQGDSTILLTGETGTGKGWTAQLIHSLSARAGKPFVEVNCAGLSATFLESELFGHERGAFTDAKTQKVGLFEIADGGTLFLDEVGDLAPELQPKLLKVLESQRFRRLGGTREMTVDVRVIAATNRELQQDVQAGRFRSDLYFRLAVLPLRLPPLRERGAQEIMELASTMFGDLRRKIGRGPDSISPEALALLGAYGWPGNIRQLRNVLERAIILAANTAEVRPEHLPPECLLAHDGTQPVEENADMSLVEMERHHIARVLAQCGGNRSRCARVLGISRATLYEKMRRYQLDALTFD
jgi:two-component system, NtrC family, response regulator AtoC